ncbi:MAG: hypothetical protein ACRD04_06845 [Terriglobales bacterium]
MGAPVGDTSVLAVIEEGTDFLAGEAAGVAVEGGGGDQSEIIAEVGVLALEGGGAKFEDGAVVGLEAEGKGLVAKNGIAIARVRRGGKGTRLGEGEAAGGLARDMEAVEEGEEISAPRQAAGLGGEEGAEGADEGAGAAAVDAAVAEELECDGGFEGGHVSC